MVTQYFMAWERNKRHFWPDGTPLGGDTCLPHDRPNGGQGPDALLRVRPVKPHVTAVEEVRHWQLHADIVENDLQIDDGSAKDQFLGCVIVISPPSCGGELSQP